MFMRHDQEIHSIGRAGPRADARAKVCGAERYAADYYAPDQLWAGVKRAGIPHARLLGVEVEAARRLPGVVAVLTAAEVGGSNRQGVARRDQPVLVDDKIRHAGDAVALVVAENREALTTALAAISCKTEPLPSLLTIAAALEPEAPRLHEDHPDGNLLLQGKIITGEGEAALEGCPVVVTSTFKVGRQEHAYLETECGFAIYRDDRLEITVSTQTPFRDRAETAAALGLEPDRVRIIAPYCGGAFGGKDGITVQTWLGLAALHGSGRPVKMWSSREESLLYGTKRHSAEMDYRLGADREGNFIALSVNVDYDTGPYDHLGGVVLALGLEHAGGPYRIPNTAIGGRVVYTNNPIGGAFRGFGVPQVAAAMEQMVDLAAAEVGLSPLEIRRRNGVRRGDRNSIGVTLTTSTGLLECLRRLGEHRLWQDAAAWKAAADADKIRGVGLAAVMHGMGYGPVVPDVANARLELTPAGNFRVYAGVVDMGQGNAATYLQIAGELLAQDPAHLELVLPDTDRTLPSGSSSASRTTYTFANALIGACEILSARLRARAADLLMVEDPAAFTLLPGCLRHLPSGREIPLVQLAAGLNAAEREVCHRFRAPVHTEQPVTDNALRMHGLPHLIFSYGAHLAAVEIDRLTGVVTVCDYLAVTDCGRLLNPQLFEQQMQGGIAQGIGYALYEDLLVAGGRVLTPDFATYLIPGAQDLPDFICTSIDQPETSGPFGLKGVGEISIDAPLPALANAVANASGRRFCDFPLTAEKLLAKLERPKR